MDGVSIYESRLSMGEKLARKILKILPDLDIDVVMPVPDTSRTSALKCSYTLRKPYREGFIKNRYIHRTFIMPVIYHYDMKLVYLSPLCYVNTSFF